MAKYGNPENLVDIKKFDLRKHLAVGDRIVFHSFFAADTIDDALRSPSASIVYTGTVTAIYKKFCYVKLKHIEECVNRWDIISVNGVQVHFH